MRIAPVTGDLPPVAALPPAPPPVPAPPPPAAVAPGGVQDAPPPRRPVLLAFDPPLIAQRAALGLPVGMLITDYAQTEGISYLAASAAVDRELPREA